MTESVIAKIKKLLNIAQHDGSSDGDIEAAMRQARRMMDRHHLTEDDLAHEPADDYAKVDEARFGRARSWVGQQFYKWESSLAVFISDFVGLNVYVCNDVKQATKNGVLRRDADGDPYCGKQVVFYGIAEDAEIASELYDELHTIISTMAMARYNQVYRGEGGAYAEGFVLGLAVNNTDDKKEEKRLAVSAGNTTALLVIERRADLIEYKRKTAKSWVEDDLGVKMYKGTQREGANGSSDAFGTGYQDGKRQDVIATRRKKLT